MASFGGDAQSDFTQWCAAQGLNLGAADDANGRQGVVVPVAALADYLEGLGFPNSEETRALIGSVCQSAGRLGGLRDASEFCPVFMPAFRAALEQMRTDRKRADTGTDHSNSDDSDEEEEPAEQIKPGQSQVATQQASAGTTTIDAEEKRTDLKPGLPRANFEDTTRRMLSGTVSTTEEIKKLVSSAAMNTRVGTTRDDVTIEEEDDEEAVVGGEAKASDDAVDERGIINNPMTKSDNQIQFGGFLNLKQVSSESWHDRGVRMSWSSVPNTHFSVRGSNYLSDRVKENSNFAIYEPVSMDIFQTNKRWFCTADAFWMPRVPAEKEINGMPSRLTIEITFPNFPAENAVWGTQKKNGPSHVWVASFVLSEKAKAQLRAGDSAMTPGLKLAREFCSPNDPLHSAFKTIIKMDNQEDPDVSEELGFMVRGLLSKYNAKPYLSNKSHRVVRVSLKLSNFCIGQMLKPSLSLPSLLLVLLCLLNNYSWPLFLNPCLDNSTERWTLDHLPRRAHVWLPGTVKLPTERQKRWPVCA